MRRLTLSGRELTHLSEEVLERGGAMHFEASGGSMLPFIRPRDVLEVWPVSTAELAVGDVVLYRAPDGRPVAHRLVRRARREAAWTWVVCADARPGDWEYVQQGALLGRVVAIQRDGKQRSLDRGLGRMLGGLWARGYPTTLAVSFALRVVRKLAR